MIKRKKKNPAKKWYVGVLKPKYGRGYEWCGMVFSTSKPVTKSKFGRWFKYAFGPYKTKKEAIYVRNFQGLKPITDEINQIIGEYLKSINPPKKAERIYAKVLAIEAEKGQDSLWKGEEFRHEFDPDTEAEIWGLPSGDLLIRSKKGRRLWKKFKGYRKGIDY